MWFTAKLISNANRGFKFDMLSSSPHVFKFYPLLPLMFIGIEEDDELCKATVN
jgi:hypothetical protein